MKKKFRTSIFGMLMATAIFVASPAARAQQKGPVALKDAVAVKPHTDGLKPYREIITTKAATSNSFLKIHKIEEKYFLEIPDSLLGREIITVNKIINAAADFRNKIINAGYAGDIIGTSMFHFEKGFGNRMFVRNKSYKERASDTTANGLSRSLSRNNYEEILLSFPIKAVNDTTQSSVIDITEYLNQDNVLFGFSASYKNAAVLGAFQTDRSYTGIIRGSADNLSMRFVRTYARPAIKTAPAMVATFEIGSTMILLPKVLMAGRKADRRVGYQQTEYIDFDKNPLGVQKLGYINRWRLEPRTLDSYKQAMPDIPKKQIVFYLDPLFPKKWTTAVKAGLEAWNVAFEKAGFKNAILVLPLSPSDSSHLEDSALSGITFKAGQNNNNITDIVVDPRTGEILRAQLNLYLSDINDLYKQYVIQAGALDKAAQKPGFDDVLMNRLIQAYVTQHAGALFGLKTNATASYNNKITDLRNNSWLSKNAFNGSATDPVLINYVAQPSDHIDPENLLPRVSPVDALNINWGYRSLTPESEESTLNKWIVSQSAQGIPFYNGEAPASNNNVIDPRNQNGDLSNNAVQAGMLGISNLKKAVPNLMAWTRVEGEDYELAAELYNGVVAQYNTYARYVLNQIGGIYIDVKNSDQKGNLFRFPLLLEQRSAMKFIQEQVFTTPNWLINRELFANSSADFDAVSKVQKDILNDLLDAKTILKLNAVEQGAPRSAYKTMTFLNDLGSGIFTELTLRKPISLNRRELQKLYVNKLILLIQTAAKGDTDASSDIRFHAKQLLTSLKKGATQYSAIERDHLTDLFERLYLGLNNPSTPPTQPVR